MLKLSHPRSHGQAVRASLVEQEDPGSIPAHPKCFSLLWDKVAGKN